MRPRRVLRLLVVIPAALVVSWNVAGGQSKKELAGKLNEFSYGVPSSPAFELLPDKSDEVTHLVTSKDFSSAASIFRAGAFLKNSVAFDARPGSFMVGSLTEYQKNWLHQVLWRSVVSFGSTEAGAERNDALVAVGVRLSLIDGSDPRALPAYLDRLEESYTKALESHPPPFDLSEEQLRARSTAIDAQTDEVRDSLSEVLWNAWKLDLGIGGVGRVKSAAADLDSLMGDRYGVWLAGGMPLGKAAQLNAVTKVSWVQPDSAGGETHRWVAGARVRWYVTSGFTLSGEMARTWSVHHGYNASDDAWYHFGLFAEVHLAFAGGWVGLGYGGDSKRKDGSNNGFQVRYSVYTDRILEK